MAEIIFRKFGFDAQPAAGECFVRPHPEAHAGNRNVSALVLEYGLGSLHCGPGETRLLVVDASDLQPTFDVMLAASLADLLVGGAEPDPRLAPFARYAGLVLQGLEPSGLAPPQSLEGIYLAARNLDGGDLTRPGVAAAFLRRWKRIFERIREAASQGKDPFREPLFDVGEDFAEERAYLMHDESVYRSDVERGKRWQGQIPGGLAQASVLLLRQPRSLMFRFWSRRDQTAPVGGRHHLLVVDWGAGVWVLTTNPPERLSLKELAERLQSEERKANPGSPPRNGWYDGADRGHSIVAAPRGGSRLAAPVVERTVEQWTGRTGRRRSLPAVAAAVGLIVLALGAVWLWRLPSLSGEKEKGLPPPEMAWVPATPVKLIDQRKQYLPVVERGSVTATFEMQPAALPRAQLQVEVLGVPKPGEGTVLATLDVNGKSLAPIQGRPDDRSVRFDLVECEWKADGVNQVRVRLDGLADRNRDNPGQEPALLVSCWAGATHTANLYVVAVGVSAYNDPQLNLGFAAKDARDLADALRAQEHRLFDRVDCRLLQDENATRSEILKALRKVIADIREDKADRKLLIVSFSGHGDRDAQFGGTFYFLSHDARVDDLDSGVSADTITTLLNEAPCPVVVLLDACHSGAFHKPRATKGLPDRAATEEAIRRLGMAGQGMIILPACAPEAVTQEDASSGNGLLTGAVLQSIYGGKGENEEVLYLDVLVAEVTRSMKGNGPTLHKTRGVQPEMIPIAVRSRPSRGK